jgi:hypothetical protein
MFIRIAVPVVATALLAGFALQADAAPGVTFTTFTDATNDIDPTIATGGGTLDLVKMEVANTSTDVVFRLTVNGNLGSVDWGKFMIGIANNKGSGTVTGNGWGRPINMSANGGMSHWIGSWVDGGGGSQLWEHGSSGWSGPASLGSFTIAGGAQSTITFTTSIASLGMSLGDTFSFDAYSSGGGGGDSAVDALANPNFAISSWGQTYTSGASNSFSYTLGAIPAPGAIVLFGAAGLLGRRRRA